MEKTISTNEVLIAGMADYEKPISQVYELEIEGDILQDSFSKTSVSPYGYDEPLS